MALIAVDVALVLRVRGLEQRIRGLTSVVQAGARAPLVEGERFPSVTLIDAALQSVPLLTETTSSGTLLFISSGGCDACDGVRSEWDSVAAECVGSPLRVLELVLDASPDALPEAGRSYPSLAFGGDAWALVGRLPGVPATFHIDASGTVRRSFYGSEHRGLRRAVEALLLP